jgi:hypothetical protein
MPSATVRLALAGDLTPLGPVQTDHLSVCCESDPQKTACESG